MTVNLLCSVNRNLPGKNVKTVSHAILLTGQEEMENLALGFKSLADVEDPDQRRELESAFIASYMSYTFSKYTARRMGIVDVEEICISSMIHNLGQMIVLYYYPEAYFEIKTLIRHGNTKRKAARKVMGTTYDTIGIHFARIWNFSFNTIESLRVCYFNRLGSTLDNLVINMPFCAAELCAYSGGVLGHKQKLRLRELVNAMNMFSRDISVLVNRSWSDVRLFCKKQKLTLDKREVSSIAATE